ncbi:MAG: hypothetical protein ACREAK_00765, partial [Nitrosarchaeum sp.]
MPKTDSSVEKWTGEQIKIESKEHFENLLEDGYEVLGENFSAQKIGDSDEFDTKITLLMKKDDKQFLADALAI